ncbi:MAG: hypothetical protein ACK4VI_05365 [Alphaproteobacteria bacterium]
MAEIITPKFTETAQNRDFQFAPDLKAMSAIVAEMSTKHAYIRSLGDWRSSGKMSFGEPHRFLVFSFRFDPEYYGLDETARPTIQTVDALIDEITQNPNEVLLAVTRLDQSFEKQWPRELASADIQELAANPVELRFQTTESVVLDFRREP